MLTIRHIENENIQPIYDNFGLDESNEGANFVMYDDDAPVALWRMKILFEDEPIGLIDKVFFKEGVSVGDKLFFVHAMFFKLIEGAPLTLRMNGVHKELERFGFEQVDGNMEVFSQNINLHYGCAGHRD